MMATAKKQDESNQYEIAREELERADGDVIKATETMVKRVRNDRRLYQVLMDPLVKNACYEIVCKECRQRRAALWHMQQPSADQNRERVIALAGGTLASLMDFPLPGGLRLGDAKRDEVSAAAEFYSRQSKDMGLKARWLQLIAQHIPAKKLVRQVMSDERLAELRKEAGHE